MNGQNYYRLKQIDFDGTFSYSAIRQIQLLHQFDLALYPNPTINRINLSFARQLQSKTLEIFDKIGKLVDRQLVTSSEMEIGLSNWPTGLYILKIKDEASVQPIKFLKIE